MNNEPWGKISYDGWLYPKPSRAKRVQVWLNMKRTTLALWIAPWLEEM